MLPCSLFVVLAKTEKEKDRGISVFIVERDFPRVSVGKDREDGAPLLEHERRDL
jgi:alkylation response protein AidB-like acyl-CoA dehydrogenase